MREKFRIRKKLLLGAAALVAISIPIASRQINVPQNQSPQSAPKLSFEVASIKEWMDGKGPAGMVTVGVQFSGDTVI